jgi:hypothetical protein
MGSLVGGLLVDMLGVFVLATAFLILVQRLHRIPQRILNGLFAGLALGRLAQISSLILGGMIVLNKPQSMIGPLIHLCDHGALVLLLLSIALGCFLPKISEPLVRVVRLGLLGLSFSALWIVPQLLFASLIHEPTDVVNLSRTLSSDQHVANRRILWILFDELSYHQLFDHPVAGIELPNFDRLRARSISFGDLQPAGFNTDRVIPSLFLGKRFENIRSTTSGQLLYWDNDEKRWIAYDASATLFGVAQRNGWKTGVDGWFNPYCRILGSVLNSCHWGPASFPNQYTGASGENSAMKNGALEAGAILDSLTMRGGIETIDREQREQEQSDVLANAQALIDNRQIGFAFFHFYAPHPPGIYDRESHRMRTGGNYLDNLVLADDTLGLLLKSIEATPSAGDTTIIVSSDHSWRTPIWRASNFWSEEEERASQGGHFDTRPVLLIHFPSQTAEQDVNSPLPQLLEHDIIEGMLRGQISSPQDLTSFLSQRVR